MKIFDYFLSIGEQHYSSPADKFRLRLFNLIFYCAICIILPVLLVLNIIQKNEAEIIAILIVIVGFIIAGILNFKGYNQIATIGLALLSMGSIWFVSLNAPTQTGAPYGNILIALCSILLIKRKWIKKLILFTSILSFVVANYYQLKNLPFNEAEYAVVILLLLLTFFTIMYYDHLMVKYQNKIEEQSDSLIQLEQEKHEKELLLKQKDLEMMLSTASARDKLTNNLSSKLVEVLKSENITKAINNVIFDLKSQGNLINRQTLIHQNINEVNAVFFERLLEKFPTLTKSERDLCSFLKLGLSNKEIATLKNSTENTVNVSKSRLRKKIGLESNKELQRLLLDF